MFYLIGEEEILTTVAILGNSVKPQVTSEEELYFAYIAFVNTTWPTEINKPIPYKNFLYDLKEISKLIRFYVEEDELTIILEYVDMTRKSNMDKAFQQIDKGLKYLQTFDENLFYLFNLCIHTLFYSHSPDSGGGTSIKCIGAIWCSNRKNWSIIDTVEFLIHELTHTLLFHDEYRYQHYLDAEILLSEDTLIPSAILSKPRPLNKSFHSLVVAHEIIMFRRQLTPPYSFCFHANTEILLENSYKTIGEIKKLILNSTGIVSERFCELLNKIDKKLFPK